MVDLAFAAPSARKKFDCETCKLDVQKGRRCQTTAFDAGVKIPRIDDYSVAHAFCPGKATWYPDAALLFTACRVALESGILPREGALEDQDEAFAEAFPVFVHRWRDRSYDRMWDDIRGFTKVVLEGIFGKK